MEPLLHCWPIFPLDGGAAGSVREIINYFRSPLVAQNFFLGPLRELFRKLRSSLASVGYLIRPISNSSSRRHDRGAGRGLLPRPRGRRRRSASCRGVADRPVLDLEQDTGWTGRAEDVCRDALSGEELRRIRK